MSRREMRSTLGFVLLITPVTAQTEGWQKIVTRSSPGHRDWAAMAYDEARGVVVLFGGSGNSGQLSDTWIYDGHDWDLMAPATVPARRDQHCMAYDPLTQRVLMYGGRTFNNWLGDTWEWSGTDWIQVGAGADIRLTAAMAFDPVCQQMLRFGGNGAGGVSSDTRAWTGSQWVLLTSGGPAPREHITMATDRLRQRIVLFGGYGPAGGFGNRFDDTWEWDGGVWMQRLPAFAPPRLSNHATAFHAGKGWTLVMSGEIPRAGGPVSNHDLYAWDGTNWSLRNLSPRPPQGLRAPMVYDSARDLMVYFARGETWEYTAPPQVQGSFQPFGQGCPGPSGTPTLDVAPGVLPYIGYPLPVSISNIGPSPFVLPFGVLGTSNSSWNGIPLPTGLGPLGFPGCTAYTNAVAYDTLVNQGGSADWTIQVPGRPSLVGSSFYLQSFVLDPGAPGGGVVTNAAAGTIGQR